MNFNVGNRAVWNIFGIEVWITDTIVNAYSISAVLILLALVVRWKLITYTPGAPKGLQNAAELAIESFDNFAKGAAGPKLAFLGKWFFAVFIFIMCSNLSGMIPKFRPPTADWSVTFSLAVVTFFLINIMGAIYKGPEYWKGFLEPFFLFLPLNILGELAKPISLSFRLFGNILAGMILMSILYEIGPTFIIFVLPSALHAYFDTAMGILQAYIFTVLSLSFIGAVAGTAE